MHDGQARTPGQRARTSPPISRIFATAIGAWASYSRNLTRRPPVWSRTTPENRATPPAPGSATASASARSRERLDLVAISIRRSPRGDGGAPAHRWEEAELVPFSEAALRRHVVVTEREEGERAKGRAHGAGRRHGLPGRLNRAALGQVHLDAVPPDRLSVPGEEADPHLHREAA